MQLSEHERLAAEMQKLLRSLHSTGSLTLTLTLTRMYSSYNSPIDTESNEKCCSSSLFEFNCSDCFLVTLLSDRHSFRYLVNYHFCAQYFYV